MKFVEPHFEIIEQENGLDGIFKMITKAGFTCYRTEKELTPESCERFTNTMINSGHYAMIEHGAVYLKMEWNTTDITEKVSSIKYKQNRYSIVNYVQTGENIMTAYVTTNYRVLVENGWVEDLKYLCDPTEYHEKRISVRFWMDRVGSQSVERHRGYNGNSFAQESTRYVSYNKEKFGSEITISVPHWTSEDELNETIANENYVNEMMDILEEFKNSTFYNINEHDKANTEFRKLCYWLMGNAMGEFIYMKLIECGMKAEDARSILPLDINTEFVVTMYESDWKRFMKLRAYVTPTNRPHPDINKIASNLLNLFHERNLLT